MSTQAFRRGVGSIAICVLVLAGPGLRAQQDPRLALDAQIGRIFQSPDYQVPRFGPARWLPDGTAYTTVEKSPDRPDAWDIVRYEAGTGARSILIAGSRLVPPGASKALDIDDYVWSADGKRLLIFTNTRKVWRDNTRGDYWVLEIATRRSEADRPRQRRKRR